jgi:hypothetical protein
LYGYTKKEDQVWFYSDAAVLIISDYMLQLVFYNEDGLFFVIEIICFRFPEIIAELIKKPKDDTYPELNIWPARKGYAFLLKCSFIHVNYYCFIFTEDLDCKKFVHGLKIYLLIQCH